MLFFNHRSGTVSLLLLGVSLTACGEADLDGKLATASQSTPSASAQLAQVFEPALEPVTGIPIAGCSTHNVIGELDSRTGDCSLPGAPASPNWARHRMFGDSTPDIAAWTEAVPGELQRYCSYEYIGRGPIEDRHYEELFAAIDAYPGMSIESAALDCRTEGVQGNGLEDSAITAQLADAFHRAIQWIPGSALRSTAGEREAVEVAILDTVSRQADEGAPLVNQHGRIMDRIISEIACPDGASACSNTVRHHLAMPRHATKSADWAHGGDFGTMGDLATAIVAAVGHWRMAQLEDPNAPKRLVINASLGWVTDGSGSSNVPERALEQALEFAACNGALVIAAAGNVDNPTCTADGSGPLAPAAYQLVAAPDAAECARLGYAPLDSSTLSVFGGDRPLVYAAGGLDGRDRPILNGRPEAMPPLAAYADHVSVAHADGFTTPLTGTSISTAVVSATASVLWSYAPELTPGEVMQLIYDSGSETGRPADFGFVGEQATVHRVSVCAALAKLCSTTDGGCPELECGDPTAPQDGYLGGFFAAANAAVSEAEHVRTFAGPAGQEPVCEREAWDERIEPQPEHPACPACGLDTPPPPDPPDNTALLSMTIASAYVGTIVGIELTVWDPTGTPAAFTLDGDVVRSVNDPNNTITRVEVETGYVTSANLSFELDDTSIVSGPILVY